VLALLLGGCTAALVPGEVVLPGDRAVDITYGPPASETGATVAWREGRLLATAGATGVLTLGGGSVAADARWAGWWGPSVVVADMFGVISVDGLPTWEVEDAVAFASGEGGMVAADATTLYLLHAGRRVRAEGLVALAVGDERVLGLRCAETCEALAWTLAGEPLGAWGEGGEGGAVTEWRGEAWVSDPDEATPDGRGVVTSESGERIEGEPGDHLGVALGGGYAAGVFNKWIVPPRGRVVPLGDGPVFALERGAEDQPMALSGDAATLVVGAPFYPYGGSPTGAVLVVER
jgi:hypothetical protein